jgi:hypothetical protein
MAKGIRSKTMRKHRTILRQTVYAPIIKANQEKIAKQIAEDLKKTDGSSITQLRKLIKTTENAVPMIKDNELSKPVTEGDETPVMPCAGLNSAIRRGSKVHSSKKKGSKPNANPGKQLAWFR